MLTNALTSKFIAGGKSENFALIWVELDFLPVYSGKNRMVGIIYATH